MKFEYPAGATPLDPDEIVGLSDTQRDAGISLR